MHQLSLDMVSQGTLMGLLHLFLPNPICFRLRLAGSRSQGPALSISMTAGNCDNGAQLHPNASTDWPFYQATSERFSSVTRENKQ